MENELEEELVAVKENCPTADLPSEDRNVIGPAKLQIHFLHHILVKSDTDIGCGR
jgi:hypothetical protein